MSEVRPHQFKDAIDRWNCSRSAKALMRAYVDHADWQTWICQAPIKDVLAPRADLSERHAKRVRRELFRLGVIARVNYSHRAPGRTEAVRLDYAKAKALGAPSRGLFDVLDEPGTSTGDIRKQPGTSAPLTGDIGAPNRGHQMSPLSLVSESLPPPLPPPHRGQPPRAGGRAGSPRASAAEGNPNYDRNLDALRSRPRDWPSRRWLSARYRQLIAQAASSPEHVAFAIAETIRDARTIAIRSPPAWLLHVVETGDWHPAAREAERRERAERERRSEEDQMSLEQRQRDARASIERENAAIESADPSRVSAAIAVVRAAAPPFHWCRCGPDKSDAEMLAMPWVRHRVFEELSREASHAGDRIET